MKLICGVTFVLSMHRRLGSALVSLGISKSRRGKFDLLAPRSSDELPCSRMPIDATDRPREPEQIIGG